MTTKDCAGFFGTLRDGEGHMTSAGVEYVTHPEEGCEEDRDLGGGWHRLADCKRIEIVHGPFAACRCERHVRRR